MFGSIRRKRRQIELTVYPTGCCDVLQRSTRKTVGFVIREHPKRFKAQMMGKWGKDFAYFKTRALAVDWIAERV